jgi:hypothetical protein
MAKRKQSHSLNPDILRTVGLVCILVLGIALAGMALAAYGRGICASSLFTVRQITIAQHLQPLELPELAKLKGKNLFSVDLPKAEAKVHARYPQLAELRVIRRFPDEIFVTAVRREPFAKVFIDGHSCVIDRQGYMIGAPIEGQESLTVIKGLKRQKVSAGELIRDERVKLGVMIIMFFREDRRLSSVQLETVHVDDLTRIVCDVEVEEAEFQAIMDKENITARLKMFSDVLSRGGLDLQQIKYMDFRFGEPILGQKKVKK